jgi:hypothetical protein
MTQPFQELWLLGDQVTAVHVAGFQVARVHVSGVQVPLCDEQVAWVVLLDFEQVPCATQVVWVE